MSVIRSPGRNETRLAPAPRESGRDPFLSLHRAVNRLFDAVFRGFALPSSLASPLASPLAGGGWPSVEITDGGGAITVPAEVPGLEDKDIALLLDDGVLTLRGEKRAEVEDRQRRFSERVHGRLKRRIPRGAGIDEDAVEAQFRNGVLTVTLPKTETARSQVRRIAIKS